MTRAPARPNRIEPRDSLDYYPTPPWATRALMEYVLPSVVGDVSALVAWDPACGEGYMSRPLGEYCAAVYATDIADYGQGRDAMLDFLGADADLPSPAVEWIITNPPYSRAHAFVSRAIDLAPRGVAMLLRTAYLEGVERYRTLYNVRPPALIAQYAERVGMTRGRVDARVATAVATCWLIWTRQETPLTQLTWIPPCRARLRRPGDEEAPACLQHPQH